MKGRRRWQQVRTRKERNQSHLSCRADRTSLPTWSSGALFHLFNILVLFLFFFFLIKPIIYIRVQVYWSAAEHSVLGQALRLGSRWQQANQSMNHGLFFHSFSFFLFFFLCSIFLILMFNRSWFLLFFNLDEWVLSNGWTSQYFGNRRCDRFRRRETRRKGRNTRNSRLWTPSETEKRKTPDESL